MVLLTGCGTVTKDNNIAKTKTESTEQQWANEVTATIDAAGNVTVISENSQTDSATDAGDEHNKGTNSSALDLIRHLMMVLILMLVIKIILQIISQLIMIIK